MLGDLRHVHVPDRDGDHDRLLFVREGGWHHTVTFEHERRGEARGALVAVDQGMIASKRMQQCGGLFEQFRIDAEHLGGWTRCGGGE